MGEARVKNGDWAVLSTSDGRQVLGHVVPGNKARVGRLKRDLYDVHDGHWGTLYTPQQQELVPCAEVADDDAAAIDDDVGGADNRLLQDNNDNQLLTQRDITRMKRDGRNSGAAVVNAVVSNSATFQSKTKFSQEKYVRRKRNKFDVRVRVIKPTSFSLCQTYFRKSPDKIMCIRTDTLALLIGSAGVAPGRHIVVVDECTGLITGAVAEKLRGYGRILNMFKGSTPPGNEILRMLNLPKEINDAIVAVPFDLVPGAEESGRVWNSNSATKTDDDNEPIRYTARDDEEDLKFPTSEKRAQSIAKRPKLGLVKQWMKDGFDCLVVAVRHDVVETFDLLFRLLAPSGTFAAYCPYIQDAAELQFALQMSKMAIRVELTESLLTQHQVLPGRSHPEMSGSATGGYIVSGIRVELPQAAP